MLPVPNMPSHRIHPSSWRRLAAQSVESLKHPLCVARSGVLLIIVEKNEDNSLLIEEWHNAMDCNVAFGYLPR